VKYRGSVPLSRGEPGQVGVEWRNSANKIARNFRLELCFPVLQGILGEPLQKPKAVSALCLRPRKSHRHRKQADALKWATVLVVKHAYN
jgi:hypothetical protein